MASLCAGSCSILASILPDQSALLMQVAARVAPQPHASQGPLLGQTKLPMAMQYVSQQQAPVLEVCVHTVHVDCTPCRLGCLYCKWQDLFVAADLAMLACNAFQ